jgi:hypothetical protein
MLRATGALDLSYSSIKRAKRPPGYFTPENVPKGSLWFEKTANDYFDGARSLLSLLGFQTLHHVAITDRANLKQRPSKTENQALALQRLYYNMMLLCKWHGGSIPRKEEESTYWRRAGLKASAAELRVLAQPFRNKDRLSAAH